MKFIYSAAHMSSWQLPRTTGVQCWLHLLFREERCCSFTFRVTLKNDCWLKNYVSTMSAIQENTTHDAERYYGGSEARCVSHPAFNLQKKLKQENHHQRSRESLLVIHYIYLPSNMSFLCNTNYLILRRLLFL